jgi:beta-aspartyl-peptidase (threonine type)
MAVTRRSRRIVVHEAPGARARPSARRGAPGAPRRRAGWRVLAAGGAALDAAIAAVALLEDDPAFNAGPRLRADRGDARSSMDASVMSARRWRRAPSGAVRGVRNPVHLARAHLDEGASYARRPAGARPRGGARARRLRSRGARDGRGGGGGGPRSDPAPRTVGAVARRRRGHVAAATHEDGSPESAPAGRRLGADRAGTYADDRLAPCSRRGPGRRSYRTCLVRAALSWSARGLDPAFAAGRALEDAATAHCGTRGLILSTPRAGSAPSGRRVDGRRLAERTSEATVVLGA